MKKFKICLAAAILSLAVLSGCGMAEDGYIEDEPAHSAAPIESPAVTTTPRPAKTPDESDLEEDLPITVSPTPEAQPSATPKM